MEEPGLTNAMRAPAPGAAAPPTPETAKSVSVRASRAEKIRMRRARACLRQKMFPAASEDTGWPTGATDSPWP